MQLGIQLGIYYTIWFGNGRINEISRASAKIWNKEPLIC